MNILWRLPTLRIAASRNTAPSRSYWYRRGYVPPDLEPGQYPFPKRQVPECGKRTFEERTKELYLDNSTSTLIPPVDIGSAYKAGLILPDRSQPKNTDLESVARKRLLKVPLEAIHHVSEDTQAPMRRLLAAQHYDIFNTLFSPPHFFVPSIHFDLYYIERDQTAPKQLPESELGDSASKMTPVFTHPVHTGNLLTAERAMESPLIDLSSAPPDNLWTVVMTCPDEPMGTERHPEVPNEYVHWMVTNLKWNPSTKSASGDEVIPYLPPLPYLGTGYHRYVFVLYRQDNGSMDFGDMAKPEASKGDLGSQRQFNTLEFYRRFETHLTPVGLAFFQSAWDESVRDYFRNVLDTPEPIFELQWPAEKLPPQEKFPVANSWSKTRRHPQGLPLADERYGVHTDVSFDVYLDRFRDRKELAEELVRERLVTEGNPLNPDEPKRERVPYPAAVPMQSEMPSWWVTQERKRRLRQGRWRHLEGSDD